MYTIYMHICPDNKVYIGCTQRTLEQRFGPGGTGYMTLSIYNSMQPFGLAIQKIGWENIKHIVLATTEDREEASRLEQYYINLYDATNPEKGYNIHKGGIGKPMGPMNKQSYEKMIRNRSGRIGIHKDGKNKYVKPDELAEYLETGWLRGGEPRSDRVKQLVSKANKGRKPTPEQVAKWKKSHIGFRHTEEAKAKMSAALKGKNLGKRYINKNGQHKMVPSAELEQYLSAGWVLGFGSRTK